MRRREQSDRGADTTVVVCLWGSLPVSAATWEKSRVVAGKNAYRLTENLTQTRIAVLEKS